MHDKVYIYRDFHQIRYGSQRISFLQKVSVDFINSLHAKSGTSVAYTNGSSIQQTHALQLLSLLIRGLHRLSLAIVDT